MRRPWPKGEGGQLQPPPPPPKKEKIPHQKEIIKFSKLAVFEFLGVVVLKIRILVF